MVLNLLLILDLLFLALTLVLVKESIREQEKRAVRVGSLGAVVFVILGGFIVLFPQTHMILTVLFTAILLVGVAILIPGRKNPKALKGTAGYAVGTLSRLDESYSVFVRNRGLPEGSEAYKTFYAENPDLEERDRERRKKGLLGKLGSIDGGYPPNSAMVKAAFDMPEYLGRFSRSQPADKTPGEEISPEKATAIVKQHALHLGAKQVGICELNPAWAYAKRGEIHYENWEDWGREITDLPRYAVVFLLEMNRNHVISAPHTPSLAESATNYAKGAYISTLLARWFSHMGYRGVAEHTRNYDVILPPVAVDAGLGEIGRQGYLIAPEYGARVRIFAVLTDMPLVADSPISLGVEEFCQKCLKCADSCPSRSIPKGSKTVCRGAEKWKLDEESCFAYWARVGTDCCICMAICPFSRPNTRFHSVARWLVSRSLLANQILPHLDNFVYGKHWRTRKVPNWLSYPKRSEMA